MNSRSTSATLAEIIGVAVEYNVHLDPNKFVQYLDLYCTYLAHNESVADTAVGSPATFYEFISSASMLESVSSMTTFETGERLDAPAPLNCDEKSNPADRNLNSGK